VRSQRKLMSEPSLTSRPEIQRPRGRRRSRLLVLVSGAILASVVGACSAPDVGPTEEQCLRNLCFQHPASWELAYEDATAILYDAPQDADQNFASVTVRPIDWVVAQTDGEGESVEQAARMLWSESGSEPASVTTSPSGESVDLEGPESGGYRWSRAVLDTGTGDLYYITVRAISKSWADHAMAFISQATLPDNA
jgi:hypothetical protein